MSVNVFVKLVYPTLAIAIGYEVSQSGICFQLNFLSLPKMVLVSLSRILVEGKEINYS